MLFNRVAALALCCGVLTAAGAQEKPKDPAARELEASVKKYAELRKRAATRVPKLKQTSEPSEIKAHVNALTAAIKEERKDAKQGDIFTPAVRRYILEVVGREMKGAANAPAREMAKDGNPAVERVAGPLKVQVNAAYPEREPLSSTPPSLLAKLPPLPKDLSYRFVGRDLLLVDSEAAIILDYIPNALPAK